MNGRRIGVPLSFAKVGAHTVADALDRCRTLAFFDDRRAEEAPVIPLTSATLLHRHGGDWLPLQPAEHSSADHDVERRLLKGDKLFKCTECDLEILLVPPDAGE
jgi:hypothetical protein